MDGTVAATTVAAATMYEASRITTMPLATCDHDDAFSEPCLDNRLGKQVGLLQCCLHILAQRLWWEASSQLEGYTRSQAGDMRLQLLDGVGVVGLDNPPRPIVQAQLQRRLGQALINTQRFHLRRGGGGLRSRALSWQVAHAPART
eukprot:scaffold315909_cov28-Tisochrysis_lutea.AAC.1